MVRLIYSHGHIENPTAFSRLDNILSSAGYKGHRVDYPFDIVTLDEHIDRLDETVASIDEPIVLIGASKGSMVSTEYTARHPENIAGLILISPVFKFDPLDKQSYRRQLKKSPSLKHDESINFSSDAYLDESGNILDKINYVWDRISIDDYSKIKTQTAELFRWDVLDSFSSVKSIPKLFIVGKKDKLCKRQMNKIYYSSEELVYIPKTRHKPHIKNYNEVSQIVLKHLMTRL